MVAQTGTLKLSMADQAEPLAGPLAGAGGRTLFCFAKNWRITFRVDETEFEIIDLDYEDYH